MNKKGFINFNDIKSFEMSVNYIELAPVKPYKLNSHIHKECEIYVNLSGDVSFMVENSIYPVLPGNVIITRPFEYHHCIYHSDSLHKHFWIVFSCNGNEKIFDLFFSRKVGEKNLLIIPENEKEEFFKLCNKMAEKDYISEMEKYYDFFSLIKFLEIADIPEKKLDTYHSDVSISLEYINKNIENSFSIKDLAKIANVSVNTLERHFKETLEMTPRSFIRKKRLANAVKLLSKGESVADACIKSGFSDFSSFISLFKKNYGVTPLKYKKATFCSQQEI